MVTTDEILEEVSSVFDCPVSLILSKIKSTKEIDARHAAIYLIKTQTEQSNTAIAKIFGYRHPQTVCKSKTAAEDKMTGDPIYRQKITIVVNSIVKLRLNLRQQGY